MKVLGLKLKVGVRVMVQDKKEERVVIEMAKVLRE
jgi:hypothetical protein